MKISRLIPVVLFVAVLLFVYWLYALPTVNSQPISQSPESIARGEYLLAAGGCVSCHISDDGDLSGGLALESEFGTFYAPNITPDMETGIGGWSGEDFLLAMQHGRKSGGGFYFPAFPYRSYAGVTDEDVLDIAAYLMAQEPVNKTVPAHDTPPWLSQWLMPGWNVMANILQGSAQEVSVSDGNDTDLATLERGAYLVRNLGHCGECHTPRNALGIMNLSREFAGGPFEDGTIEAIDGNALANWTEDDFSFFLFLGMKPDEEFVGGKMEPVIEHNTSKLTEADQQAMAAFFKSLAVD